MTQMKQPEKKKVVVSRKHEREAAKLDHEVHQGFLQRTMLGNMNLADVMAALRHTRIHNEKIAENGKLSGGAVTQRTALLNRRVTDLNWKATHDKERGKSRR
jgi:hypothetical protein